MKKLLPSIFAAILTTFVINLPPVMAAIVQTGDIIYSGTITMLGNFKIGTLQLSDSGNRQLSLTPGAVFGTESGGGMQISFTASLNDAISLSSDHVNDLIIQGANSAGTAGNDTDVVLYRPSVTNDAFYVLTMQAGVNEQNLLIGTDYTNGRYYISQTIGGTGVYLPFVFRGGITDSFKLNIDGTQQEILTFTVSTLPTCNSGKKGTVTAVTDATSPTYNGTLTGSGTVYTPVICNGTAWVSH